MCFSATVSFTTGTLLLPVSAYALRRASLIDKRYYPLAAFPLLFGMQQIFEGVVWLGLSGVLPQYERAATLGFLFFAFLLWPILAPFAAWRLETDRFRRGLLIILTAVGAILGGLLYFPLLLDSSQVSPAIVHHSITYSSSLFTDGLMSREFNCAAYALVITAPLLVSSLHPIRLYGLLLLISVIVSAMFFHYAFTSVWCLFAALLSIYTLRLLPKRTTTKRLIQ